MLTTSTQLLAVIGDPIEHSLSPLIHGRAIDSEGLDFAYLAFRVKSAEAAVAAMRHLGIRGFSVTIPHKEAVIPHLDRLDASAERCRSVNTIVNDGGVLTGFSTDGPGAVAALRAAGVEPKGRRALVVGTGGASRAVAFALLEAGLRSLSFRSVLPEQAAGLRRDLEAVHPGSVSDDESGRNIEILVNASPVGMHPRVEGMPVETDILRPDLAVFDVVYNPLRTRLLAEAAARGCRIVDGAGMFAEQAALQFELFTGRTAPRELMMRTVRDALSAREAGA